MSDIKNPVCVQCIHSQCCAYKEAYNSAIDIMKDAFNNMHGCDTSFMEPCGPRCKLFLTIDDIISNPIFGKMNNKEV